MPRPCSVCVHNDREAIDMALVSGEPCRALAARFDVSPDAMERHRRAHIPGALAAAAGAGEVARGDELLAELGRLKSDAYRIRDRASKQGDHRTALAGVRELVRIVELLCKLHGTLKDNPTVNLLISPEWGRVRSVVFVALGPFPEARAAVAHALLEAGDAGA